ncbi:MAG: FecR domain-containing protein [Marinilabiliaceae bacterium]|nr:FecR domain-containing protein [Marinilabiliaceae bacterium]
MKEIDKKYQYISRHLAGEETVEEEQVRGQLEEEDASMKNQFVTLKVYWTNFFPTKSLKSKQNITAKVMHSVLGGYQLPRPRMARWYAAVGILAIALATSVFWGLYESGKQMNMIHYQAEVGEVKKIVLPDGTQVSLNATSSLVVPESFEGDNRQVILTGEGYFNVTKDAAHPFVISTSHVDVKVLGTQFNLKAYAEDNQITTFLDEGKVQLTGAFNNQEPIYLNPGQEAVLSKEDGNMEVFDREDYQSGLWREGQLVFYNNSLAEIVTVLQRKFGVEIVILNEEVKNYKFSGDFNGNQLFELLGFLAAARPFTFEQSGDYIVISK